MPEAKRSKKGAPVIAIDEAAAKKATKKQQEADKIKIVVQPLDSLEPTVDHPRKFLIAKASFESAVDTKLSRWEKETIEGEVVTKSDEFLADIHDVKEEADVVALGVDKVAEAATAAAGEEGGCEGTEQV